MKNTFYILGILITCCSCSQEKQLTKTLKPSFFNEPVTDAPFYSGVNTTFATQNSKSSGFSDASDYLEEIRIYKIPQPGNLPNSQFPDWQSFQTFYLELKPKLSVAANQRCIEILLQSYKLYEQDPLNKESKEKIRGYVNYLISTQYHGYELLYTYFVWMQKQQLMDVQPLKQAVLAYAKPLLAPPDPNLKNDPLIEANPALKQELDALFEGVKRNDAYIEKISSL